MSEITFDAKTAKFELHRSMNKDFDKRGLDFSFSLGEKRICKVSISFDKGGISYTTYKTKPKGFYVNITPADDLGNGMISWAYGDGCGAFLEEAARFSKNTLMDLPTKHAETINELVKKVIEREKSRA